MVSAVDFLLKPDILPEKHCMSKDGNGLVSWFGSYVEPVPKGNDSQV